MKRLLMLLLLVSCASQTKQQFPATDPDRFCGRYEACFVVRGLEFKPELKRQCMSVATMPNPFRDAYVNDCYGLPACAFVYCMQMHTDATTISLKVSEGR